METMENKFCLRLHKQLSFNGVAPSVLKSAVQKYLRRKVTTKGIWSLVELDLFELIENNAVNAKEQALKESLPVELVRMNAKKIRTNMINRLIVIMSEEININCWWLPIQIKKLYEKWCQTRQTKESRRYLLSMYMLLIKSEKLRLISDLKTVYNLPPYYMKDLTKLKSLHKTLLLSKPSIEKHMHDISKSAVVKPQERMENFKKCILNKDEDAFYWLSKLIDNENKSFVTDIWDFVCMNSPKKAVTDALKFFFKTMTHQEKWIYLYHAILLIIHQDSIKFDDSCIDGTLLSEDEVDNYYSNNLKCNMIEIDDFVHDIHTGEASKNAKTEFALKGAWIPDENKTFFKQEYRDLYIKFKEMIDEYETSLAKTKQTKKRKNLEEADDKSVKKKNSKMISFVSQSDSTAVDLFGYEIQEIDTDKENSLKQLPQAQKRTSNHKKAVYVDKTKVYKGPYDQNDVKLLRNLRNVKAVLLFQDWLELSEEQKNVEDWKCLYKNANSQIYLVSNNVGNPSTKLDFEIVSTKIETNVKVIKRQSFVKRISEIEQGNTAMNPELIKATMQHLYFRFLIQVGDSASYNVLLREDGSKSLVAGIDLEEYNSSFDQKNRLSMLCKRLSKDRQNLYKPYLTKIKVFENGLDQSQKSELMKLGFDTSIVDKNIERWIKATS